MRLMTLTVEEAVAFLEAHKRHYAIPDGTPIGAIGIGDDELRGAAILARVDSHTACLAHIYVDGSFGGYTHLYGACWRALHALGYEYVKL